MEIDWNDLRVFLAIARAGSLTAAARALKVSQPTVSRRLAALEADLGVKLFERGPAGYTLSDAGDEIRESAQQVADEIDAIQRKLYGHDRQIGGPIRLTCTEVMSNLYLAPHLARFAAEHPEIDLSLSCTFQYLSLSRREADIALRVTSRPHDTLIGRRLVRAAVAVYGRRGALPDPGRPESWTWIGWQDETYTRMMISASFPAARIRHRVDDLQTMRAMIRQGLGVSVLPCYMADIDPELERALPEPLIENDLDIWVLIHPDVRDVARIRLFSRFLTQTVLADRELFEGDRPLF